MIREMFFVTIWFVKTSTRIMNYESRVVTLNPENIKLMVVEAHQSFQFLGK